MRVATGQRLKAARNNPKTQAKLASYLTSDRNPFRNPAVRARAQATLAAKGWQNLKGGNGTGPTIPQATLHELLGPPWKLELVIKTGMPRGSGYPQHYKADIGHPALKIAVEVHGKGHGKNGNARDRKKKAFLESRDWTVIWIWNEEILSDPSGTLRRIQAIISPTAS